MLTGQRLLVATGRRAGLAALGVGAYGIDETAGMIPTDERMRAADGLWAIGDVTGKGAFPHVSMYQAAIAARDILGADGPPADYRAVPRVTFTDPEIGSTALSKPPSPAWPRADACPPSTASSQPRATVEFPAAGHTHDRCP